MWTAKAQISLLSAYGNSKDPYQMVRLQKLILVYAVYIFDY